MCFITNLNLTISYSVPNVPLISCNEKCDIIMVNEQTEKNRSCELLPKHIF